MGNLMTPGITCPKKGIISTILFWGWDLNLNHQSYFREGSGFLGMKIALNKIY